MITLAAMLVGSMYLTSLNRFLNAVEQVESRGNTQAVGAKGELGSFQFTRQTWEMANRLARARGWMEPPFDMATTRTIARRNAELYFNWLNDELTKALHRPPSCSELYAAWNLGFAGFKKCGFSLSKVPSSTSAALERLRENLRRSSMCPAQPLSGTGGTPGPEIRPFISSAPAA